ncbi:MAG: YbaK/EbsC family protein [Bacillota bacterium]|nr:YbaK/EbsC family protein [Bacillota bacterium]
METEVTSYLDKLNVPYAIKPHSKKLYTVEEVAADRGIALSQILKTMILTNGEGKYIALLLPGDVQLSWRKLKDIAGKGYRMVAIEEVERLTNFEVGAVSPVTLKEKGMQLYLDQNALAAKLVDISSGIHEAGIQLAISDLQQICDAEVVDLGK